METGVYFIGNNAVWNPDASKPFWVSWNARKGLAHQYAYGDVILVLDFNARLLSPADTTPTYLAAHKQRLPSIDTVSNFQVYLNDKRMQGAKYWKRVMNIDVSRNESLFCLLKFVT